MASIFFLIRNYNYLFYKDIFLDLPNKKLHTAIFGGSMNRNQFLGHCFAVIVILFWGLTFVSCKVLLKDFTPVEILFDRFVLATLCLLILSPFALKFISFKVELYSALAGFFGVTIYFVFENNALIYSNASNVCLIVSTAPLFVAIFDKVFNKGKTLSKNFILGFILAMTGIACLSFNSIKLELNPLGDLLALGCAVVWGFYNIFVCKVQKRNVPTLVITIKSFFYAVLQTTVIMAIEGYEPKIDCLLKEINIFNFLFLAVLASSLSFLLWNKAIEFIGSVKTNVYIYATPVVTTVGAVLMIDETITEYTLLGMVLAISGLVISQLKVTSLKANK